MDNKDSKSDALALAEVTFKLLSNCQEKERRFATRFQLTQSEFRCLRTFRTDETVNNKEIAQRMNLTPSRSTRIIDRLVDKGYITREIDPDDRRSMLVSLSKRGVLFSQALNKAFIEIHKQILQEVKPEQRQSLITAVNDLLSALEKWLAVS